jgi:hypothetical protein
MASPEYHFVTGWKFANTTIQEIADILEDVESLSAWWPSVYLDVKVVEAGGSGGVGKRVSLLTKGYLPYRLRWSFVVTESDWPRSSALRAEGDFNGRGEWTLTQEGPDAKVVYDWRILAEKPMLRRLSWLLRPLFSSNHRWAMDQGERALVREVARRREAKRASTPSAASAE